MGTGPLPEVNDSINGNQQYSNSIASPQNIEVTESALMDTQRSMDYVYYLNEKRPVRIFYY